MTPGVHLLSMNQNNLKSGASSRRYSQEGQYGKIYKLNFPTERKNLLTGRGIGKQGEHLEKCFSF